MGELSVADVLNRAADRLARPGGWTQNTYARRADGMKTDIMADDACAFCLAGAIAREFGEGRASSMSRTLAARRAYLVPVVGKFVAAFNDDPSRTQAEVVAALREAATLAQGHAA